ncbi:DNA primase [Chitinivorax tropicus]|uniref:DNA primase n=1 Tax=Chitinivorax tropicus TaxID=714531 RepID=A0A840MNK1_9PROT|nr:DNA primase [Chitinivorax tropicus]
MSRIPDSFIQDLLNRVDIVDVVDRYVPLKKSGSEYKACCPFHNEKTPSFYVSPVKQFYHCFGCGANGTVITFVMEHAGLNFIEAVTELAQSVGMQVPAEERTPEARQAAQKRAEVEALDLPGVMRAACIYYRNQLKQAPHAIQYLKRRGVSGEIAARFGLGFAPDGWSGLKGAFTDYDTNPALIESGLVKEKDGRRYDFFNDRVMFPIVNQRGAIIGFGGRVMDKGEPKYLNSPETVLFEKGRELYGLYQARQAIRDAGKVLVVEGYMDVVSLAQYGVGYAVATLGTATTAIHLQKLMRHTDHLVFCFDGDKAGRKAAWRALENALPQLQDDKRLDFLFLPEDEDPDSYVRHFGKEAFEDVMARDALPLTAFMLRELSAKVDLQTDEGRARMIKLAQPLITQIPAQALSLMLRKRLAEILGIESDELDRLLGIRVAQSRYGKSRSKPVPFRTGRRQAPSIERKVIEWFLRAPGWAQHIALPAWAGEHPEMAALYALYEYLIEHPGLATAAQVLECFRESEHEGVLRRVLSTAMEEHEEFSDEEAWVELNDAVTRLIEYVSKQQWRGQMTHVMTDKNFSPSSLSEEEKELLRQLALAKSQPASD